LTNVQEAARRPRGAGTGEQRPAGEGDDTHSTSGIGLGLLVAAALGIGLVSLLFPSTPSYDPWSWLIWGREIMHLDLVTRGGPSWKPLPVLFTAPFSIAGADAAPLLWLAVARAGAVMALMMAFKLAWRLAGRGAAGQLAGLVASLGILGMTGWLRAAATGNSEGLLITFVLIAIDRHLDDRRDHAFLFLVGAALLRPEVWPFLGLYGLALWLWQPGRRPLRAIGGGCVLALWFLPELWGSGRIFRSAERARDPLEHSIAFAEQPAIEVLRLAGELPAAPLLVGAIVAFTTAVFTARRASEQMAVLGVCLAGCAWVGLIMAMTEAGYSGNPRYLMLAGAFICVLGGVGLARLAQGVTWGVARAGVPAWLAAAGATVVVAVALALSWPSVESRARDLTRVVGALRAHAESNSELAPLVEDLGGRTAVLRCGRPTSGRFQRPIMAWTLGVHARHVAFELTPGAPGLVFRSRTQRRPDPRLLPRRYRSIARRDSWEVSSARCARPR